MAQTKHSKQSDEALKFLEIEGINHSDSQILLLQTYLERNNIKKAKEYADKILHNSDITEEQKKMIQDQLSEKVNEQRILIEATSSFPFIKLSVK